MSDQLASLTSIHLRKLSSFLTGRRVFFIVYCLNNEGQLRFSFTSESRKLVISLKNHQNKDTSIEIIICYENKTLGFHVRAVLSYVSNRNYRNTLS